MPDGYNDGYDEWLSQFEDYRDPMEEARAAALLAEEMRKEEEALSSVGRGIPLKQQPQVQSTPVLAGPSVEDWRNYVQTMSAERGVIPVPQRMDYDAMAASEQARQKYEAQKMYNFYVNNGMAPADAMSRSGAGMFASSGSGLSVPKPMSEYQQAQVQRWQQPPQITPYQQQQMQRWKEKDEAEKLKAEGAPIVEQIKALEKQIWELEKDIAQNPPRPTPGNPGGAVGDDRSWLLGQKRQELQQLRSQRSGVSTPNVTAPGQMAGTQQTTAPKYRDGTRLKKADGSIWIVRNGVPVRQ